HIRLFRRGGATSIRSSCFQVVHPCRCCPLRCVSGSWVAIGLQTGGWDDQGQCVCGSLGDPCRIRARRLLSAGKGSRHERRRSLSASCGEEPTDHLRGVPTRGDCEAKCPARTATELLAVCAQG